MASSSDFVQYIADQCAGAGEIVAKKMFGDYGIYCDGKIFGLICDDGFYLKPTDAVRPLLRTVEMRPPYEGAKDYFYIARCGRPRLSLAIGARDVQGAARAEAEKETLTNKNAGLKPCIFCYSHSIVPVGFGVRS